ncbi:hypothetical protein KR032_011110 [Drosophila birchii]|nr:hypothetical protein KR032_011110 [Drosophila birchii]
MFESISFLFLLAMAVLSWAVLCLQHAVEIQRRSATDYRMEVYTGRPEITFEPRTQNPEPSPTTGPFNFALSFWSILVLTFVLSKLLQLVEGQVKNYLKNRETLKPANAMESLSLTGDPVAEQMLKPFQENQQTLDPVMVVAEENAALKDQLNVLESHCLEMRELIHDLRLSKSSSSQSEDEGVVTVKHSEESLMVRTEAGSLAESVYFPLTPSSSQRNQNIYITNSHIHIRGPIFCSDNNFSTELTRQASMYARKQSEFVQVWGKYITSPKERPMIAGSIRCHNILM